MIAIEPKQYYCNVCGAQLNVYIDEYQRIRVQECMWCKESTTYINQDTVLVFSEDSQTSSHIVLEELAPLKNDFLERQRKRWQKHQARRGKKF